MPVLQVRTSEVSLAHALYVDLEFLAAGEVTDYFLEEQVGLKRRGFSEDEVARLSKKASQFVNGKVDNE